MKKVLIVFLLITVAAVGILGYLTSGFTSSELTMNPEGSVSGVGSVQKFDGWQFHYVNTEILPDGDWKGDATEGYDSGRAVFTYDEELLKKYEDQGYKVEVGIILGSGLDLATGARYNSTDKLTVVEKSGVLVSATDRAEVFLLYSSDEEVEMQGWHDEYKFGDETRKAGNATITFESPVTSQNPYPTSLVARSFVRLTSKSGSVKVLYDNAKEVMSISPLVFGD